MERHYDLVVVGTGIASGVASRCREAGWTVAVVDSRPFGGTCARRGCVPKKILVSAAEAVHAARDMDGIGVPAGALGIDWPQLMKFKRSLVDPTPERTAQSWAKIGVDRFHGRARFVAPTTLSVGDDRLVVRATQRGTERRFEVDMAIHSAGRVPEIDDLDLATAGVEREKRGVRVNEFLQSVSNPLVYAGGDAAASGPPLTPKASHDAEVLTTNLLEGNRRRVNYEGIASAVFSLPPLASAGLTEEAARARNLRFRTTW